MRAADWDIRLAAIVAEAREKPFKWGQHDCALWAMDVRTALTGAPEAPWRGKYSTVKGAAARMAKMGYGSLEAAGDGILGERHEFPLMAKRGDIVLAEIGGDDWPEAFGVCVGASGAFVTPEGLTLHPMSAVKAAWKV